LDGRSSKPGRGHNHKQLLAGDQRARAPVERATFRHGPNVTSLFQRSVLTLRGAWHGRNRRSSMSRPATQSDVSPGGRSGRLYPTPHRADRLVTLRNQRRSAASTKDPCSARLLASRRASPKVGRSGDYAGGRASVAGQASGNGAVLWQCRTRSGCLGDQVLVVVIGW